MKKVLFFFPHNPFPAKTGAHKRCLELLTGLKELGCHVTFASSTFTPSDQLWSSATVSAIQSELGCTVTLHTAGYLDRKLTGIRNGLGRFATQEARQYHPFVSVGMKSWFTRVAEICMPDIVFINYMYYDRMIDRSSLTFQASIVEIHDLVTLNSKMQEAIVDVIGIENLIGGRIPMEVLDLNFFNKKQFSTDSIEFEVYNKYDVTLCISEAERDVISSRSPDTNAVFLPMSQSVSRHENNYSGNALFSVGPNLFNVQGYYFFMEKILPLVRTREPYFKLIVTGNFNRPQSPKVAEGIEYLGFVDDLHRYYEVSGFFVCPVFAGTGQQIKIIEAMANGLAVVAFNGAALRSPLRHGENGLIADNVEEFAEHVLQLWSDRSLCRRLGTNARNTVAQSCNRQNLVSGLASIIS